MMMALFYLARKRHAEEAAIATGITLPFQPEYADDGFCGGRVQDGIRYFREEIRLAEKIWLEIRSLPVHGLIVVRRSIQRGYFRLAGAWGSD